MRRRLLAGLVAGLMIFAPSVVQAKPTAKERQAQHQQKVREKIGCNRAEERAGKCATPPPAPARAPAPAVAPSAPAAKSAPSAPSAQPSSGGAKKIVITISQQRLRAYEGDRLVLDTAVSTGKSGYATPRGTFSILSKTDRHWSTQYHVWMPWAMRVVRGIFIHEIPISPDGRRLGADQLGQPVSAGCVRVGIGPAERLYRWAPVGTPVIVQ